MGSLTLGIGMGLEFGALAELALGAARGLAGLDVSVEVTNEDDVERRLLAGEFDAAILAPIEPAHARLNLCLVHSDELVVGFADWHRFAKEPSVTLEALEQEPLVVRSGCRVEAALASMMEGR